MLCRGVRSPHDRARRRSGGISIGVEALTAVGRSVRARFTSVPLGVPHPPAIRSAESRTSELPPDWGELGPIGRSSDRAPASDDRPSDRVPDTSFVPSSAEVVGASGRRTPAVLTAAERTRDSALCDGLAKLRSRVQGGTLTRGQLRAHVMHLSGLSREACGRVPMLRMLLASDAVPTAPVHMGDFDSLLACMNAYVTSQYPPPAPPAPSSGGPLVTPAAPSTKRICTLVVDDSDAQAPAASGSDGTPQTFSTTLPDITASSWADVAPSSLAMSGADDTPSRGRMMPMPGTSTSVPPPSGGVPTPHEALIQGQQQLLVAAQRSADAHELAARAVSSTARDSRITADASERADAKLRPNAFRQKHETRRWVACNVQRR